ncbi:MAG: menaquinone-dependent protoporphyrinogen IX dehydrogenase [Betaproteobacteria bacterium]|nr:menaquinone-dependent protoporphyrinogen IX dehydrogenase [Betaproteobacteria bacterium]
MARILVIYSTTDGHTQRICDRLRDVLERQGHQVTVASIRDEPVPELNAFDKIVIGASIRYGRHSPLVFDFIRRNQRVLDGKPSAFFSVNVVARKPEKNRPETNPYVKKFLKQIAWKPGHLDVFAGRIDYPSYSFGDRMVIRFIMWITNGPTDPKAVVEFTDWNRVEAFGLVIATMQ